MNSVQHPYVECTCGGSYPPDTFDTCPFCSDYANESALIVRLWSELTGLVTTRPPERFAQAFNELDALIAHAKHTITLLEAAQAVLLDANCSTLS